jgi:hypothetical protein
MKFYAYIPMKGHFYSGHPKTGDSGVGVDGKLLFELKTVAGAHRRAQRAFKNRPYKLFRYTNFYNEDTFRQV